MKDCAGRVTANGGRVMFKLSVGPYRPRRLFGPRAVEEVYLGHQTAPAGRLTTSSVLIPMRCTEDARPYRACTRKGGIRTT